MIKKETLLKVMGWQYNSGNTGLSSECLAARLCGVPTKSEATPCDPSDFNRCLNLLIAAPELRESLYKMKSVSKKWSVLIDHWDALESTFINEVGVNWARRDKKASETYKLMKEIGL